MRHCPSYTEEWDGGIRKDTRAARKRICTMKSGWYDHQAPPATHQLCAEDFFEHISHSCCPSVENTGQWKTCEIPLQPVNSMQKYDLAMAHKPKTQTCHSTPTKYKITNK